MCHPVVWEEMQRLMHSCKEDDTDSKFEVNENVNEIASLKAIANSNKHVILIASLESIYAPYTTVTEH